MIIKCLCFFFIIGTVYAKSDDILVKIEQGWLLGEYLQGVLGDYYYSFKGIPYAKPPVGPLRFKDPQKAEAWVGVRNATKHGAICSQVGALSNPNITSSEDCLFLNVYSPDITTDTLLPVIVFIHGGLYKSGSGNVDSYGPDFLVRQSIVVVTINYRLGALGFLSLGTKCVPGNAGLKDQNLALKWVQKNIKKFGGDPDNVTLMGQSAGAASVTLHILSPMSKGLFRRAACLSGVAFADFSIGRYPKRRAFALAKSLGFETQDTTELLTFLQSVPHEQLMNTTSNVLAAEEITTYDIRLIPFAPVQELDVSQENNFLPIDPYNSLTCDNVDIDVYMGYTEQEMITYISYLQSHYMYNYNKYPELFVPSKISYKSTPDLVLKKSSEIIDYYFGSKNISSANMQEFVSFTNNYTFVYDIHRFARKLSRRSNVYFYKFTILSNRNFHAQQGIPFNITGPGHLDDLLYYFDAKALNMTLKKDSIEYELVKRCNTLLSNFAKYGNPTPDTTLGITWPTYDEDCLSYLDLGNTLTVKTNADEADVQFWKGIFKSSNIPW